ncbi:MAG: hypothetical protein JSV06_10980, partial [Myxococcales bacterium]
MISRYPTSLRNIISIHSPHFYGLGHCGHYAFTVVLWDVIEHHAPRGFAVLAFDRTMRLRQREILE